MVTVVEVQDLHKSYDKVERLHGISFEVQSGEILGFLGTNGAGKTTTIEILEGYRARDAGRVSVLGVDPAKADRAWRNRIGLVLQECELDPVYTVRETVSMFAHYFHRPTNIAATIDAVGLSEQANERAGHLSGGQKRRLDVALGLIGDPEMLFLDEPTTGLDPLARREMWTMIEGLRNAGKTIFLTTHYMDEAEHLADRIIILRAGEIAAQGTADELTRGLGDLTRITFSTRQPVDVAGLNAALRAIVHFDQSLISFDTMRVQDDLKTLLAWAESERLELLNLQVVRPSLDDVFVKLAGEPATGAGAAHE